jgi:hypothetical protein
MVVLTSACPSSSCTGFREHGDALLPALPLAHRNLPAFEVDILHAEVEAFEQTESCAVESLDVW